MSNFSSEAGIVTARAGAQVPVRLLSLSDPEGPILLEMEPTVEARLTRIREVTHNALRYYATAYLNTDTKEEHMVAERDLLMAYMTQAANIMALLDDAELGDRAMLTSRHEVVSRYSSWRGMTRGDHPVRPRARWRVQQETLFDAAFARRGALPVMAGSTRRGGNTG